MLQTNLKLKTGAYHFDFTIRGKRFKGSTGTGDKKLAAAHAAQRYTAAYEDRSLDMAPTTSSTLQAACTRFCAERPPTDSYVQVTQKGHFRAICRWMGGDTKTADITDEWMARLVVKLRENGRQGPATINRHVTTLHVMCERARSVWRERVGAWTPAKHRQREPGGREAFITPEQANKLLEHACAHLKAIIRFDCLTGLRKGNLLGITWEEILPDLSQARLRQKGDRPLIVDLSAEAQAVLRSVQPDPANREGPVWTFGNPVIDCRCSACMSPAKRGQPIISVRMAFVTAAKRAGLRNLPQGRFTMHGMRHSFASWVLAETGDMKVTQEAMGHANIRTTARYAHLLPGARRRAVDAVGSLLAGAA